MVNFFKCLKIKCPQGCMPGKQARGDRGALGGLVHHRGVALHYMGSKNLWEVLFGCPFSLKHRMNLRWNSTGRTADASHTVSTSDLSASESHRLCQLVASFVRECVGLTWPTALQSTQS